MGIPSFFSYIIKQHNKNVLYHDIEGVQFGYLFIDANSLIYDVYNRLIKMPLSSKFTKDIDDIIINEVGEGIEKLIKHINPNIKSYIAFDGICPFAKMKHQRNRRLKSYILKELTNTPVPFIWDTTNITPGTTFMKKLTEKLKMRFNGDKTIIFSGADMVGEGETKICQYIRELFCENKLLPKIAFYGLDNDIIMLSILHLHCSENIVVFREEPPPPPPPSKTKENKTVLNEYIYIDIHGLVDSILYEMNCEDNNYYRVIDYVFLCFFLGNDFLPKFPAIQIRTHGITFLLDTYREHIGKYNGRTLVNYKQLTNNIKSIINWKYINIFIQKLAVNEHKFIILESEMRDKLENSVRQIGNISDPENMPILYREVEKYIWVKEAGWEWRYYKGLFCTTPTPELKKEWCLNYLEGLEWTFRYYTGNCPDWRWVYRHEYSPLLQDLTMWVPRNYNYVFFTEYKNNPYSTEEQLKYVMPPIKQGMLEKHKMLKNVQWKWAYCRYLWEANVVI